MKKSLIAILLCVAMLISLAACRKKSGSDNTTEAGTSAAGDVTEAETAEAGVLARLFGKDQTEEAEETVIETATDKDGNTVTKKVVKTTAVDSKAAEELGMTPEEQSFLNKIGLDVNKLTEEDTSEITMAMGDGLVTETGSVVKVETVTSKVSSGGGGGGSVVVVPKDSPSQSYKEIIATGKYTMKATIKNGDVTVPVTLYVDNGGKYSISTKIKTSAVSSITAQFLSDGKNVYLILPSLMMYINAGSTDELLGDQNAAAAITDPTVIQGENAEYVQTLKTTVDGKEYTVEEYKAKEGQTIKYYYQSDDLKRIESVEGSGEATIIEITSVTGTIPASAFSIPSTYKDMTKVFNEQGYEGLTGKSE